MMDSQGLMNNCAEIFIPDYTDVVRWMSYERWTMKLILRKIWLILNLNFKFKMDVPGSQFPDEPVLSAPHALAAEV